LAEGRKIVASLHFRLIFFLLGEKSLRTISYFFLVLLENTKFTKNTKNLPRIPRTHMKSLHYWFLVSCVIKGVKSSLRFISNLFLSYWAKNRFAPFLTFFWSYWRIPSLPRIPRIYQEYQEHTWNRFTIGFLWYEGRKIVASLHFKFIFFLLGEKSLRIISDICCLIGWYQVYQEYQEHTWNHFIFGYLWLPIFIFI
jgi:hypothetical protein